MPTEDSDKRMVIVDNNGTEIADSLFDNDNVESFKKLQSFQNAKNGETGLLTEKVNGKNMSSSYTPIKFAQTNWIALLFIQYLTHSCLNLLNRFITIVTI